MRLGHTGRILETAKEHVGKNTENLLPQCGLQDTYGQSIDSIKEKENKVVSGVRTKKKFNAVQQRRKKIYCFKADDIA